MTFMLLFALQGCYECLLHTQLTELRDEVQPLVEMVKDGRIPPGKASLPD